MVHIVGAGPGDPELITVKGRRYLEEADVVIYAGSLVNPALLAVCREDAVIHNSAKMTLDEVIAVIEEAEAAGKMTVPSTLALEKLTNPFLRTAETSVKQKADEWGNRDNRAGSEVFASLRAWKDTF